MKKLFSKMWGSSSQPRKQRKFLANAPNHIQGNQMAAGLDKTLRSKYGIRNIEVKKGDEVKIMRGEFRGKIGKVSEVDRTKAKILVDGVQRTKKGGDKVNVPIHPSNVKIVVLETGDSRRMKRIKKEVKKLEDKK